MLLPSSNRRQSGTEQPVSGGAGRAVAAPAGSAMAAAADAALPPGSGLELPPLVAHCTAACPSQQRPAWEWRQSWEAELREFVRTAPEGRQWQATMAFVKPHDKDTFLWNVY